MMTGRGSIKLIEFNQKCTVRNRIGAAYKAAKALLPFIPFIDKNQSKLTIIRHIYTSRHLPIMSKSN